MYGGIGGTCGATALVVTINYLQIDMVRATSWSSTLKGFFELLWGTIHFVSQYFARQQRLCLYCDSQELDDEIHFLLRYNFHSDARDSLIHTIAEHLPVHLEVVAQIELFIDIMTSKNKDILNALVKFVDMEFMRRELKYALQTITLDSFL